MVKQRRSRNRQVLNIEALAIGHPAAAQIERVHCKPVPHELLGHPSVVTAVRIETRNDHDDSASLHTGTLRPDQKL
jgi:hypothetical protein